MHFFVKASRKNNLSIWYNGKLFFIRDLKKYSVILQLLESLCQMDSRRTQILTYN
jgi:hypothetical protein